MKDRIEALKAWLAKELLIEVPNGLDSESFLKGYSEGVIDHRKQVKEQLRRIT